MFTLSIFFKYIYFIPNKDIFLAYLTQICSFLFLKHISYFVQKNIKEISDTVILLEDLEALEEWEQQWDMEFHTFKCNVMTSARTKEVYLLGCYREVK